VSEGSLEIRELAKATFHEQIVSRNILPRHGGVDPAVAGGVDQLGQAAAKTRRLKKPDVVFA
jgi:hypothetical protein